MIYVTWQPEIAEAGHYFLTTISNPAGQELDLTVGQIMEIAHGLEDLEPGPYELCSIIHVIEGEARVICAADPTL